MGNHRCRAGDPSIAVAYLRVSTDEQRLGPEAQRSAIEQWATGVGVVVCGWHADHGVSGANEVAQRPALIDALAGLRAAGAGLLVVARRDRLARDVLVAAAVERLAAQAGARVVSADGLANGDDPASQFMRRINDATSEYERALIAGRTRAALAVKRARGESTGVPPFGSRLGADGKTLEPDQSEQSTIASIAAMRSAGASVRAIVASLAAAGVVARTGRPLAIAQVHRIVARLRELARSPMAAE